MRSDLCAAQDCESFRIIFFFFLRNTTTTTNVRDSRKMDVRIGAGKVTKVDVNVCLDLFGRLVTDT